MLPNEVDTGVKCVNAVATAAFYAGLLLLPVLLRLVMWLYPRLRRFAAWANRVEFGWAFERRVVMAVGFAVGYARWAWGRVTRPFRAASFHFWQFSAGGDVGQALANYADALPKRSGLTHLEEWRAECDALPPGPERAAIRHQLAKLHDSPYIIREARRRKGRPMLKPEMAAWLRSGAYAA